MFIGGRGWDSLDEPSVIATCSTSHQHAAYAECRRRGWVQPEQATAPAERKVLRTS
jgi:hypothetical protein